MRLKSIFPVSIIFVLSVVLGGCKPQTTTEPVEIKGDFSYTNEFAVETYYVEQAVMLTDMHGFVIRDMEWELPIDGQVLGYMDVDYANNKGSYQLSLPEKPLGTFSDVDNNGKEDKGVQIFAVAYSPNLAGGPFSEGDDKSYGWPGYLASIITDSENEQEVTGGKLVIWAPDNSQQFPTGFGEDGLLFTQDDPAGPVEAGYSIVDLETKPFTISREEIPSLTLYEPSDVAVKDFSSDTYVDAFQKMFDFVKVNYAFNGIAGKQPDWDAVYAKVMAEVQNAQDNKDSKAFYLALRDFTYAFNDGHVGLSGGEIENTIFNDTVSNGYGFAIRELDDGRVMVSFVLQGGPADKAGLKLGAVVTMFNDQPIKDAISAVVPSPCRHPCNLQCAISRHVTCCERQQRARPPRWFSQTPAAQPSKLQPWQPAPSTIRSVSVQS